MAQAFAEPPFDRPQGLISSIAGGRLTSAWTAVSGLATRLNLRTQRWQRAAVVASQMTFATQGPEAVSSVPSAARGAPAGWWTRHNRCGKGTQEE